MPIALLTALLLSAGPDAPHEVSLGVSSFSYAGFSRGGVPMLGASAAYHFSFGPAGRETGLPFRLGIGARFAPPNTSPVSAPRFPAELFVQLQLHARIGPWDPVVGPELGVSGLTDLGWTRGTLPDDLFVLEQARVGLWYAAFTAAPLRYCWRFERWSLTTSLLAVTLGTTLSPPGASSRTELSFLQLGVAL